MGAWVGPKWAVRYPGLQTNKAQKAAAGVLGPLFTRPWRSGSSLDLVGEARGSAHHRVLPQPYFSNRHRPLQTTSMVIRLSSAHMLTSHGSLDWASVVVCTSQMSKVRP